MVPAGRVSSEIVDMTDLFPTLAAAAGEPNTVAKLAGGATYGAQTYKLHLRWL
jgi:arylsulfatase A-like enzyme